MARQWRAGGDGRSVSFPELPWKKKPAPQQPEHTVDIAVQLGLELNPSDTRYYFYCSCGVCGKPRDTAKQALQEWDLHLEACA